MKLAILGAGAWGSALAICQSEGHDVALWTRNPEDAAHIRSTGSSRYLPEARIPASVRVGSDLADALAGAALAIVATSTAGLREVASAVFATRPNLPLAWACKGFEPARFRLPHQVVGEALQGMPRVGALSGPSFAQEVAAALPTALVLASADPEFAAFGQEVLSRPRLRIYRSSDLVGVELGGAVKNVIAIAAGISDGLALGRNARAALITRGLAEITRLGVAEGGLPETFMGLAGLGDLVLTCTGDLSRNRAVGLRLAAGEALPHILAALGHVAEGVASSRAVLARAQRHNLEMPITTAVVAVLDGELAPATAVERLLAREPGRE